MKLLAVVGMSGTGKSVVTDYLSENGWEKIYFGGITYKLMEEAGIERDIEGKNEKKFREDLRKEHGPECYAKLSEPDIRKALKKHDVVLDGLYSWQEYTFLIEKFPDLKLVCIVTDKNLRYQRVAERPNRPFDKEAIVYRDLSEIENLYKGGPIAYADYYILNNGTKEDMIERLKEILKEV